MAKALMYFLIYGTVFVCAQIAGVSTEGMQFTGRGVRVVRPTPTNPVPPAPTPTLPPQLPRLDQF
jgi:hypothetical protein